MSALAQTYPPLQSIFIAWYRNNLANGVGRLDFSCNNAAMVHGTEISSEGYRIDDADSV